MADTGESGRFEAEIEDVEEYETWYSVRKSDGFSIWVSKEHGVVPRVGDRIILWHIAGFLSRIRGIQINNKLLFKKSMEQMEKEYREWVEAKREADRREYVELMQKIKDEESFETVDVSGMGSGYERACQLALRAGMKFLKENPDFHFDYYGLKNVYGFILTDTPWGKTLDKILEDASPGGMTGAMHQAVISHLTHIHKNGYEAWLNSFPKARRYKYPLELPAPR